MPDDPVDGVKTAQASPEPNHDGNEDSDGLAGDAARTAFHAAGMIDGMTSRRFSSSFGVLLFVFGAAAGFMVAFSGLGVINDATGIILLAGLSGLMFLGAFALLAFLFRKPLLRRLFGFAEAQVETFAAPLAEVARSAVDRDPQKATHAARELVQLSLARYAWMSTRRWIIGSMTALIAAIAALAGTTLLYRQNELLAVQSGLLEQQNERIAEQSTLITQSVELAEAARNAALAVEITAIAEALGERLDEVLEQRQADMMGKGQAEGLGQLDSDLQQLAMRIPILDPLTDLDQSLILRIASISQATKPYRFLSFGFNAENPEDRARIAVLTRREDLPAAYERFASQRGWEEPQEGPLLIDRPASPERGQLLEALARAGVSNYDVLTFFGMDLSFAYAPGIQLVEPTLHLAQLSFADFSFSTIEGASFSSAILENIRFRGAVVRNTSFDAAPSGGLPGIFATVTQTNSFSRMSGADFSNAALFQTTIQNISGLAMNFDGATLDGVNFSGSDISGSTFRGSLLIDTIFEGTDMRSVDFDGAYIFDESFVDQLAQSAFEGTFPADRYTLEPAEISELGQVQSALLHMNHARLTQLGESQGLFRIVRTGAFE